jgi:hypothetical protein
MFWAFAACLTISVPEHDDRIDQDGDGVSLDLALSGPAQGPVIGTAKNVSMPTPWAFTRSPPVPR